MSAIQISTTELKQAGESIVVTILRLGDEDCMTVADTAELLNVTTGGLRGMIRDHSLIVCNTHDVQLAELKQRGVIPLNSARANLLPKGTIQALVKIVNTPEAWAAYNQLWQDATAPKQDASREAISRLAITVRQSADVVMLLNDQVTAIAIVTDETRAQMATVKQDAANATLTHTQLNDLQRAIYRCSARVGFMPGAVMKEIKIRWIPAKLRGGRTWKEISQSAFAEALEFCNTWEPRR